MTFLTGQIHGPQVHRRLYFSHYVEHFHIDGFRFDLMGIMDVDTMNEIVLKVSTLRPQVMLYGEGWNMPTMLAENEKAMLYNADMMPEIAFFNDFYRDHIKGGASAARLAQGLPDRWCQYDRIRQGCLSG